MDFKKLTKEQLKKNIRMNNNITNLELYNLYRKLLTEYIIKKLSLQEYDEKFSNSELNFIPITEKEMDAYQYFSSNILKYFYIRNDIYINKLEKEELEMLQDRVNNGNDELDEKAIEMIMHTYKKVITKDKLKKGEKMSIVFYGPKSNKFMAKEGNIVLGFRYNEYFNKNLTDEEYKKLYIKQQEFLYSIIDEIYKGLEKEDEVTIIKYDEFSIIPIN